MAQSVLLSFVHFLKEHDYSTRMWERGYTADDVNQVCHELTAWAQSNFSLPGEFVVLWSQGDGIAFSGDSELAYLVDGCAYLIPSPFIEGDSEGFLVALNTILAGHPEQLYQTDMHTRVLYNAV